MGDNENSLWVGQAISGEFLFDPSRQLGQPGVVVLYDSFSNDCFIFQRDDAAAHIRKADDPILKERVINQYEEWERFYSSRLKKKVIDGSPVISEFPKEERLSPQKARHKKCVESSGRVYQGVRQSRSERKNNCWSCKRAVFSKYHEICNACGWIVCPNCGACGCCAPTRY